MRSQRLATAARKTASTGPSAATSAEDEGYSFPTRGEAFDLEGRIAGGIGSFVGGLLEELINLGSARQPRGPQLDASGRDPFKAAAEETQRQREHQEREEAEAEWRRRHQRVPYGD